MKEIPIYRWVGGCCWGPTARFAVVGYVKVDDWWYERLVAMGLWFEAKGHASTRYARLQGTGKGSQQVFMHQVVFGDFNPDHKDGDGLNNQESNLRPATRSEQGANYPLRKNSTSGEPGVSWHKGKGKWLVRVIKDRKCVFYQLFSDFDEAVQVARQKRKEIHGEFVR